MSIENTWFHLSLCLSGKGDKLRGIGDVKEAESYGRTQTAAWGLPHLPMPMP
jgi:hypothetical protein